MSLYNMMMGYEPECITILPMLGRKHNEYPRFRNCFVGKGTIEIYTRVGGSNRGCGYGEDRLYEDENFLTTFDDAYDSTYATYVFKVPEKWKRDFDHIKAHDMGAVSDEYVDLVKQFYPDLSEKGVIDNMFRRTKE